MSIDKSILEGMARALWADAWATHEENCGRCHSGEEITEVMPPVEEVARYEAARLYGKIECANHVDMAVIKRAAFIADGMTDVYGSPDCWTQATDEQCQELGWCLAMQALGHGVSWTDNHAEFFLPAKAMRTSTGGDALERMRYDPLLCVENALEDYFDEIDE